ncbi:MAG: radical SAM protein [Candidatus Pacearchaeota archaeon]|nr:radical SAM protein [Candidatus Pacearchaeota archaeon]
MKLKRKINYFLKYIFLHPRRLVNLVSLNISRSLKLPKIIGAPHTVMIEPTNTCNLKCPLCPTGAGLIKRAKGFLKFSDFKKVVDETEKSVFHIRLWNWGEPLLNKEIFKMIEYAKRKKIFVNLSTNSSFLDQTVSEKIINSGLDELIISLDGASEKAYTAYRKGGDFNKVINSIKFLTCERKRLNKKTPYIKLQFIIMKSNENEISKMKSLAKTLGVDELSFKTVGIMDYFSKEDIKKYIPSQEKYSRYAVDSNKVLSKRGVKNWCDFIWEEVVINWDGSVVPCCFDMNNRYPFGNVFNHSVKKVWNSPEYINFRKQILSSKKQIPLCRYCPGTNKQTFVNI